MYCIIFLSALVYLYACVTYLLCYKKQALQLLLQYRISSNKRRASNKRHPLISTAPLSIHIEINASPLIIASPLISVAPLNTALIRIVTTFY